MIKKKLNVIDLDKTLIPFDSFRILIKNELYKMDLTIMLYTLLRVIRLFSMSRFKEKSILYLERKYDENFYIEFANMLHKNIDQRVLLEIDKHSNFGTLNVLISASPDLYIKHLYFKLGWDGAGSFYEEGVFVHLYGPRKLKFVEDNYDSNLYDYNFAISDSSTDDRLLNRFQNSKKWILQ